MDILHNFQLLSAKLTADHMIVVSVTVLYGIILMIVTVPTVRILLFLATMSIIVMEDMIMMTVVAHLLER